MENIRQTQWDDAAEAVRDLCQSSGWEVNQTQAELAVAALWDRFVSWDGLMSILDSVYPEDIFPTIEWDDLYRDSGPRIVSLLRRINKIRESVS